MTPYADLIVASLELAGERCEDPTPLVYRRLFAKSPEMEALFVRDTNGSIRGNMLYEVIEAILDYVGRGGYGANLIRSEIVNHENLGVPPEVFATFFVTVRDTFKDLLGADWSGETDGAWNALLADLDRITAQPA